MKHAYDWIKILTRIIYIYEWKFWHWALISENDASFHSATTKQSASSVSGVCNHLQAQFPPFRLVFVLCLFGDLGGRAIPLSISLESFGLKLKKVFS
jgi:hypothetical protein